MSVGIIILLRLLLSVIPCKCIRVISVESIQPDYWLPSGWNSKRIGSTFDVNDRILRQTKTAYYYQTAYSTESFNSKKFESNIIEFEIEIQESWDNDIIIGFTNHNQITDYSFTQCNHNINPCYYYGINGRTGERVTHRKMATISEKQVDEKHVADPSLRTFKKGDIIKLQLNFAFKTITYYKNDVLIGNMFSTIMKSSKIDYRLAVSMNTAEDAVKFLGPSMKDYLKNQKFRHTLLFTVVIKYTNLTVLIFDDDARTGKNYKKRLLFYQSS